MLKNNIYTSFSKVKLTQHFPSFIYIIHFGHREILIRMPPQLEGTILTLPNQVAEILVKKKRAKYVKKED